MEWIGGNGDAGLCISWIPDGFIIEKLHKKLETLRSQYESKLSSLQGFLEKEREQNKQAMEHLQEGYQKELSDLREQLDEGQQTLLDGIIGQMTKVHWGEIQDLEAKHQREVALEVTAWRVTLEQVYKSKNFLEASEVEAKHERQLQEEREKFEKGDHQGGATENTEEIQKLLLDQKQEILSLRRQCELLTPGADNVGEQTEGVSDLEQQMKDLQKMYEEQVAVFQQQLQNRDEEQKRRNLEERNKLEEEQAEMKQRYEKQIEAMEAAFEREINEMKDKYDTQISDLIQQRLQQSLGKEESTDSDSPNAQSSTQLKHFEGLLAERDAEIKELKNQLDLNESEDSELQKLKVKVTELEEQVSSTLSQCSKLQDVIQEKDLVIQNLELEKRESEKLYRDILEKESPRSKDSASKENFSGSSVDDSFSSARDDIQDTPRSQGSVDPMSPDVADSMSASVATMEVGKTGDAEEECNDTIPFANDSSEYNGNNSNMNNNNSSNSSLEASLFELKSRVDALSLELKEAKARETTLLGQIEDSKHKHQDMIETLRHELEHDKQMEVETLQSEFKIQMDIELRRQAAELMQKHGNEHQKGGSETGPEVVEAVLCASAVASVSSPPKFTGQSPNSDVMMAERSDPLLQTANFELQAAARSPSAVDGNLSDDTKVTTMSPVSSPTEPHVPPASSLSLTDMEKEVQAMKEEYEQQLSDLRSQLAETTSHQQRIEELERLLLEAEGRYDRLMEGVHNGEHPELNQLMKDKYDQELDLAKSWMQKDFDEMLASEKKKFVERHRKLMADFMEDKAALDEEAKKKHEEEMESLKKSLEAENAEKIQAFEQEIERLNRDLDLLREVTPRDSDSGRNSTLPGIDEITLSFQNSEVQSESPNSEDNPETSTPEKDEAVTSPTKDLEYEESEEETDAQREPTLQIRSFADVVKSPPPSFVKEKEELQRKVEQLTAQVERLTMQLAERITSPQRSPQMSPHNTTLQAEDPALVAMLQSDLDRISAERETIQQTNERLLSFLSDTVKTYIGVEDTINRKLSQVVSNTPRPGQEAGERSRPGSVELGLRHGDLHGSRHGSPAPDRRDSKAATVSPDPDSSHDSHGLENTSILSNATDEGLEISQRLAESIFVGPDLDEEGEEILSDARGRLTSAVSQLLDLMERSTVQLLEAKATQEELLNTLAQRAKEVELSKSKSSELDSQLSAEIEAKEYLGLELHKAEGLIAGYTAEKESNDSRIQTLEEQREALIMELDSTRSRLEDFQRSQSEIDSVREELTHQQALLQENVGQETQEGKQETESESGDTEPALLNEVASLNQEKRELTNQLQHQLDLSRKRLAELEALAEEAERKQEAALEEKNRCIEDLRLQLENTERQLKASKAFVDEQMAEREQERDEHQREIEKMQETIEGKERRSSSQQRLQREVSDLTDQLQSRINAQESMHQRIQDLQRSLEDKEIGTKDLKVWVSELEGQLDQKGSVEEQLKQRINSLERQLTQQSDDMEEEEIEATEGTLTESKIQKYESPTVMSPVRQGPRPSLVSLEEELQRSRLSKEELDQENNVLKQQLQQQMVQISGLRNQIDQLRHYASGDDGDTTQLRLRLQEERDKVERKEAELSEAESKIERLEGILQTKQQEAESLNERVSHILAMGDALEENHSMKQQLEELQSQVQSSSAVSTLPPELLEEKNEEITELKEKLHFVQSEVQEKSEENQNQQENIRVLQQQLKERDEEITDLQDSIASLRRGEPCLDVSLPLTDEAGSMLNLSMTGRTTRSTRPLTPTSIQQEFEDTIAQREGQVESLEEQLTAVRAQVEEKTQELSTSQSRLAEKEAELESMKTEVSDKDEEIEKLQQELLSSAKEVDDLRLCVENLQKDKDNLTDQEKMVESLEESVQQKEREVYELTMETTELRQQLTEVIDSRDTLEKLLQDKEAELTQAVEERDEKKEMLEEKEHKLDQMLIQIDSLQQETSSLTTFQNELQKDFDTVQCMLDEKEKEIETLTREMTDTKTSQEVLDSMMQLERMVASLQKDLVEKQNIVDEKEEELYELHDKLEEMDNVKGEWETAQQELKQSQDALQKEKQDKVDLENQLTKERSSRQEVEEEKTSLAAEVESLKEKMRGAETALDERNATIEEQEEQLKRSQETMTANSEEISKLKEELTSAAQKREEEVQLFQEEKEKLIEEHKVKLRDIEEQLQVQDANYLALQLTSERNESIRQEIDRLRQQVEKKDEALRNVENQLEEEKEKTASTIENFQKQLSEKDGEMEEIGSMRRQLEETEEQLRYRQSVMLEVQGQNDEMKTKIDELEKLLQEFDEKDMAVSELESQLRYRQSALLDLEAEKEKIMEEKVESETKLRKDLEEKESELEKLQMQYNELKDGINEEVVHMEQEMQRSSQARVIKRPQDQDENADEGTDMENSLETSAAQITDLTIKLKAAETEMSQIKNQYSDGQDQIQNLQSELSVLQVENSDLKRKVEELETKIKDLLKTSQSEDGGLYVECQEKMMSEQRASLSTPSSVGYDSGGVFHHTGSELPSLAMANDVNELQSHVAELEKASNQQKMELQGKIEEMSKLKSEMENLIEEQKDHQQLERAVQEKEAAISTLKKEMEGLRCQLEEQENLVMTLRDQLEISTMTHHKQLASRDDQIADLQAQVQVMSSSSPITSPTSSPPGTDGKALSPQTKHQISQLKTQLRKAHAALEEMQRGQGYSDKVDSVDSSQTPHEIELEELRRKVQEQEEELVGLRSRLEEKEEEGALMEQKVQRALAEQKLEAERQDKTEVKELMFSQHHTDVEGAIDRTSASTSMSGPKDLSRSGESSGPSVYLSDSMPPQVRALLTRLNDAGEDLLSATDFALLQQCLSTPRNVSLSPESLAWSEERRKLMDTILAVKELLGQADRFAIEPLEDLSGDWRADLLQALVKVYEKEKQVLQAEVNTANCMYPELEIMAQLENRLHDLERVQQDGLDEIIKADRQSLLDEIDSLHHRLMDSQSELQDARHELDQRIATLEDAKNKVEWKLKQQVQLLEHKVQQEEVVQKDLKKSIMLERQRVSELSAESNRERSKILELQSELSSTQIHLSKVKDALEREQQRFSSVTDALEEEHAKTVHLSDMLDSTRKKLHELQDEVTHSHAQNRQISESEGAFIKELQLELEKERQRSQEFSEAEEQAQHQISQLADNLDTMKVKLTSIQQDYEERIEGLHREWMEKELQQRKDNESEALCNLNDLLDEERQSHQKSLDQEKHISRKLTQDVEELKMENERLLSSYDMEKARADSLKKNLDTLKQEKQMPAKRLKAAETETWSLQRKVSELERELTTVQERARELEIQLRQSQANGHQNGQTTSTSSAEHHREAISGLLTASVADEELKYRLAQCCTKLQIVASKLQDMTETSQHQGGASASNAGALKDETVKVVMEELSKLKSDIREQRDRQHQSNRDPSGGNVPSEQLLLHNQQMAEHIIKLKKEKEHLANVLKSLENGIQKTSANRPAQVSLPPYSSDATSDEDGVYDRTVWASEKLSLEMALDSAEHEIQRLRSELRRFSSLMKSDGQLMKLDPDKTQRLYGKYLRAESFRKALIYQKKYLLLLLGGYRDTEQETLAILASMGGHPSPDIGSRQRGAHSQSYTAFRSAGRVVIAIFRMKYLVRKWKRATRVGSPVMTGQISNQHAYVPPSSSSYSYPQHHPSFHHRGTPADPLVNTQSSSDYVESLTNGGISSQGSSQAPPLSTNLHRLQPYTTPPTKESPRQHKGDRIGKERARRQIFQDNNDSDRSKSQPSSARTPSHTTSDSEGDNFLRYLEKVQQHLSEDSSSASSKRMGWR